MKKGTLTQLFFETMTGYADRLRMHALLAYVNRNPTKSGVSFTWEGPGSSTWCRALAG